MQISLQQAQQDQSHKPPLDISASSAKYEIGEVLYSKGW